MINNALQPRNSHVIAKNFLCIIFCILVCLSTKVPAFIGKIQQILLPINEWLVSEYASRNGIMRWQQLAVTLHIILYLQEYIVHTPYDKG